MTEETPALEENPKEEPKLSKTQKANMENREALADLVDRYEKANAEQKELIEKQQELAAKNLISGTTNAVPKEEKKEETPAEYIKRLEQGEV